LIKGVACNKNHTVSWDIAGRVYSWGEALDGKLGHPLKND